MLLEKIAKLLTEKNLTITTAESCTGGLIASRLTDISGSSMYLNQSFVTYSNAAKIKYLKVSPETLKKHSAVSSETVSEMAKGILEVTDADIALAISGLAGPNSDESGKPVGLVYVCIANKSDLLVKEYQCQALERKEMKKHFAELALDLLYEFLIKNYKSL